MKLTFEMKFLAAFVACIIISTDASPLQLISLDGSCRSASQIGSYISSQSISQTGNNCPVTALIDCTSENDNGVIMNSLFETSFAPNSKGDVTLKQ